MADNVSRRRKQFSSCDGCRESRVACDAGVKRFRSYAAVGAGCSRCTKQGKRCTFHWLQRRQTAYVRDDSRQFISSLAVTSPREFALNPRQLTERRRSNVDTGLYPDAMSIHEALWQIYHHYFEAMLGSWLSVCPCLSGYDMSSFRCDISSESDDNVVGGGKYLRILSMSRLCATLDRWVAESRQMHHENINGTEIDASWTDSQEETQTKLSLVNAIHCFAARWLYLWNTTSLRTSDTHSLTRLFWRTTRRDTLKVMNKISYRSALTLLLFGLTPTPVGLEIGEEADGLNGRVCIQLALEMLHKLRVRLSNLQLSDSALLQRTVDEQEHHKAKDSREKEVIAAESAAYAAGMIFDNEPPVLEDARSALTSGLLGFDSEPIFCLFKPQAFVFHDTTEKWRRDGFEISAANVSTILLAAETWVYFFWKTIAVFKEAVREGYDNDVIAKAYSAVIDTVDRFKITYCPLLDICQQRIHFLPWRLKFEWYNLMLRYHLGIIILSEAMQGNRQVDLFPSLDTQTLDSEHGIIDVLKFAIDTRAPTQPLRQKTMTDRSAMLTDWKDTVPFITVDPYPHNVIAAVEAVSKAILRDYKQAIISVDVFVNLRSTLLLALQQIPSTSKPAQVAQNKLRKMMFEEPEGETYVVQSGFNGNVQNTSNTTVDTHDHTTNRNRYTDRHIMRDSYDGILVSSIDTSKEQREEDFLGLVDDVNKYGLGRLDFLISTNDLKE